MGWCAHTLECHGYSACGESAGNGPLKLQIPTLPHFRHRGRHRFTCRSPRPLRTSISTSVHAARLQPGHQHSRPWSRSRKSRKVISRVGWACIARAWMVPQGQGLSPINSRERLVWVLFDAAPGHHFLKEFYGSVCMSNETGVVVHRDDALVNELCSRLRRDARGRR